MIEKLLLLCKKVICKINTASNKKLILTTKTKHKLYRYNKILLSDPCSTLKRCGIGHGSELIIRCKTKIVRPEDTTYASQLQKSGYNDPSSIFYAEAQHCNNRVSGGVSNHILGQTKSDLYADQVDPRVHLHTSIVSGANSHPHMTGNYANQAKVEEQELSKILGNSYNATSMSQSIMSQSLNGGDSVGIFGGDSMTLGGYINVYCHLCVILELDCFNYEAMVITSSCFFTAEFLH